MPAANPGPSAGPPTAPLSPVEAPRWSPAPPPPASPPSAPPPPISTGTPPPKPPRKRSTARTVLATLGILVAVIVLWLIAVPVIAWSQIARVEAAPSGERPADQPGTTFLLVGSDSREGLSAEERRRLGTGSSGGQRTDTIMILSIPPGGRPALISVPRDSFVAIPGHGDNKINAAYAIGGPELLVQTVEQNTGLRIDAYTEIGFGGFVQVIDALGGIRMCLPKAIQDRDSNLDLPAGCQMLNGANALGYVRMRKADPRGDLGRVERQRQMLAAVAAEAASPLTVINPVRYWSVLTSGAQAVAIGQDTGFFEMVAMANAMRQVSGGGGLTLTVPVADPDASTSVGSAVLWDEERSEEMFADLARGDTSDLDKFVQ
jgi:LCP family protein required for cell wall assembly